MEQVAKLLGGKGNIAILTGPSGDAGGLQRMEGYENILKNYPEIKQVVAPADCQWDTASAQSTVESWLSAYDLDAIVCENDGMAVGAATQQVQTPVSLSQALTARRTALRLFRTAASPVPFLRTAALWLQTASSCC